MRVLGIDPGYAIVGWGVVEYAGNRFAPVDFGAVCTDAGVPFERRLDEVYAGVKEVIERTQPEVLAIEKLFYQHNQTTVIGVAEARGVILLAAAQAGLPPLASLAAMYVGFCAMGVAGMVLAPVLLLLVKQLHDGGYIRLWR